MACCRRSLRATSPFVVPQWRSQPQTKLSSCLLPLLKPYRSQVQCSKARARSVESECEGTKCSARRKVKNLSIEKSAKVAASSGLISMNMSYLISFTSSIYYRSVLCWKPFSKLRKCLITSQALCESQGVGMFCVWDEPWPLLSSWCLADCSLIWAHFNGHFLIIFFFAIHRSLMHILFSFQFCFSSIKDS